MSERIRSCFISAPSEANIRQIRDSLIGRGVRVLGLSDIEVGSVLQTAIVSSIAQADLVVGVLSQRESANAIFELGVAVGLGKPILIFAPAKSDIVPFDLQRFQIVRASLQNREAIDFAFDQLLASPETPGRTHPVPTASHRFRTLEATSYRSELAEALERGNGQKLETLVARVLRDAGTELVVESPHPDRHIDLVIWSDALQPYVGNPFPIEIKLRLKSRESAKRALSQAANNAIAIGSSWSMLLYADGPNRGDRVWLSQPAVLAMRIDDLFDQLEATTFAKIILSLRNRRVHGGGL